MRLGSLDRNYGWEVLLGSVWVSVIDRVDICKGEHRLIHCLEQALVASRMHKTHVPLILIRNLEVVIQDGRCDVLTGCIIGLRRA